MVKDRDEKGAYNNIVLDLFLHDEEGFFVVLCVRIMSNLLN